MKACKMVKKGDFDQCLVVCSILIDPCETPLHSVKAAHQTLNLLL